MTRLIARSNREVAGFGLRVTPGWTLELSFNEDIGTADEPAGESIKYAIEEALLTDDKYLELVKSVMSSFINSEQLAKDFERLFGDSVTFAEALARVLEQYFADSFSMSDSTALTVNVLVAEMLGVEGSVSRTLDRYVDSSLELSEFLQITNRVLQDSATVDDALVAEAIKLLADSATVDEEVIQDFTKLLYSSVLFTESLQVAIYNSVLDVDNINVFEEEELEVYYSMIDSIDMLEELVAHMEKEFEDESYLIDLLQSEVFKLVAGSVTLSDDIESEIFILNETLVIDISFAVTERLICKMTARSFRSSAPKTWSGAESENAAGSGVDAEATEQTSVTSEGSGSSIAGRRTGFTSVRF